MKIDIHTHLGLSTDGGHGQVEEMLSIMEECGITQSVIFATDEADIGKTFEPQNKKIVKLQEKYPDKFIAFARIIPSAGQAAADEFQRCVAEGVKGLKLKTLDGFSVEDSFSILELIDRENFPVIVHSSHTPESLPSEWEKAVKSFPGINFILAHAGKDKYRHCSELVNKYSNLYVDTTTLSFFRTGYVYKNIDPSRILWGSDYPYQHQVMEMKKYELLTDNRADLDKIFFQNAKKLMGLT